ncbi:MAG TPA: Crp/Fnr family transcriptional regulator [Candidatus Sulfopaludibacter sp.]|nr:Crp/Fnr family transcriptional regulator [Candidatus Sulfopaludibacter sp.]
MHFSEKAQKPVTEDALGYLPCSSVQEFSRHLEIYGPDNPASGLYLVIDGRVKLSRLGDGAEVVVDILQADDFFGESSLLETPSDAEQATAMEPTKVMTWTFPEIERLVAKEPRLAIALMQVVVRRSVGYTRRLESFSVDGTAQRLARSLLQFAERSGRGEEGGATTIAPLTHEVLAHYVGTSREIISHHMSDFRNKGYIRYSRKGITVQRGSMRAWLQLKTNHV